MHCGSIGKHIHPFFDFVALFWSLIESRRVAADDSTHKVIPVVLKIHLILTATAQFIQQFGRLLRVVCWPVEVHADVAQHDVSCA